MTATLIVENGSSSSGTPGANTYVSAAVLAAYASDRGITITGVKEDLLIKAMDYIENQPFKGRKNSKTQPLVWPRYGVTVDSWPVDVLSIPQQLINAQCEAALAIDAGNSPLNPLEQNIESATVGEVSVTYAKGSSNNTIAITVNNALKKLLIGGGGYGNMIRVTKA